ncbi:MAG: hypothetical protein RL240_4395 [Planctomycetota bacterium]|jgi:hypothetical protein
MNRPLRHDEAPIARWLALIIGSVLLFIGLSMRFAPAVWDGQRWMASDTFSKVGVVLLCMWMAWPAVEAIRKAPGGAILMIALTAVLMLFFYRPKTILFTGPFISLAIAIALLRGWWQRGSGGK